MAIRKTKEFTEREKDIYSLGFRNGANQLQITINNLKVVHNDLLEELLRLDIHNPVIGDPNQITITMKLFSFKNLIHSLGRGEPYSQRQWFAKLLTRFLREHEKKQKAYIENIEKGLLDTE